MMDRFRKSYPDQPRSIIQFLDSAGMSTASLSLGWHDPYAQIGDRFVAMMQHGSDTTGLTVVLARAPDGLLSNKDQRLGRCASSFPY